MNAGWGAIESLLIDEAFQRMSDRRVMSTFSAWGGASIASSTEEMEQPRRLRDDRERWRGWTARLTEWANENGATAGKVPEPWSPEWFELLRNW